MCVPVVLDTSLLAAYASKRDPDHDEACRVMRAVLRGQHGTPVAPDYVLDEGLTLLQRRTGRLEDAKLYASFFVDMAGMDRGAILEMLPVDKPLIHEARKLFFQRFDRRVSFTDCVVASLARSLDGSVGALEDDFEGIVPCIRG